MLPFDDPACVGRDILTSEATLVSFNNVVLFDDSELFVSTVVLACEIFGEENTILVSLGTRLGSTDNDGGSTIDVVFDDFANAG